MDNSIIIRFEQANKQTVGEITKIVGLVKAKSLVSIIDSLNLEANPRSSATGNVTDAIQETIRTAPTLMPFKTKVILLASSDYEELERDRIKITPQNEEIEGILDGGHNTLAVGLYILERSLTNEGLALPKGKKTWNDFMEIWMDYRELVNVYLDTVRNNESFSISEQLNFYIPVELLVPRDMSDEICMATFRNELFDICEARNNNVELQTSAKANQKGYFDDFKALMMKRNSSIASRVEWKTNDGGEIKAQDLVALAWIPLNLVENIKDADGKSIEPIAANKLYSGKGSCLKHYEKFMSSPDVTMNQSEDYRAEIKNSEVISALEIAVQLPELYDSIYEKFPEYYNSTGGSYGRIIAVKKLNDKRKNFKAPFTGRKISTMSPDGFIIPLVYGLQALLDRTVNADGRVRIHWKNDLDPMTFLNDNLEKIVSRYKDILPLCDYDPQKVGKASASYTQAIDAFKMAYAGLLD